MVDLVIGFAGPPPLVREVLVDVWRWLGPLCAVLVLARPVGRLVFTAVGVVESGVDPADAVEGARGGRRVVTEFKEVAVDLVRVCVVDRGGSGFAGGVFKVAEAGCAEDGLEEETGDILDVDIMDTGLVSLVAVDRGRGRGRAVSVPGPSSAAVDWADVFRVAREPDRLRPVFPNVFVLVGGCCCIPLPTVPIRDLVAAEETEPGLGSRLGDMVLGSAVTELVKVVVTTASGAFLSSSFFCNLPRPAVGCRRVRVRFSPAAEADDDMAQS